MNNSTTNWPSIDFHERLPIYYVMWNGGGVYLSYYVMWNGGSIPELLRNVEWGAGSSGVIM